MSIIDERCTSIGCLKPGSAGVSDREALLAAAGAHRFNELYVPQPPARLGWCQNERGIYVGCGRGDDLRPLEMEPPGDSGYGPLGVYDVVEGIRGTPAFVPRTVYEEVPEEGIYERKFSQYIRAKGVFRGGVLHMRLVAKMPDFGARYPEDDYTNEVRFVFWLTNNAFGGEGFNLFTWGDMGCVDVRAGGVQVHRQSGFVFPDGRWHAYDLLIYKNFTSRLYVDGTYRWTSGAWESGGEVLWDGLLIDPEMQMYSTTRPDAAFTIQSCSLEVYDAV
ncbi:hypothetical protein [Solidesulfovibrio magneticus]|uniref:Uncharacterized protein n=1 Tax=Solidesulfovibrio magneticus (strain ATCC 700980 / DSM 13731 / RS-1) TaxID=573370 RepID=C4XTJ2_SOLM1|nr:hypothetical protein [Solidesulfovibrio magneticus]BAH75989.1 hypothetical protein DMR_24980 [Solidesulfovibrio magneticus RS-1]